MRFHDKTRPRCIRAPRVRRTGRLPLESGLRRPRPLPGPPERPARLGATRPRRPSRRRRFPHLLEGRDLLGVAQTGTGKTAAFALPMLDLLSRRRARPRRPPTARPGPHADARAGRADRRELRGLRHQHSRSAAPSSSAASARPRRSRALRRGVDVLVATPGRLLDLMGQGHVDLSRVEIFVLDEADRMLDMGFLRDVRRIVEPLPDERQSLLFSATMPRGHRPPGATTLLHDPVRVEVTPPSIDGRARRAARLLRREAGQARPARADPAGREHRARRSSSPARSTAPTASRGTWTRAAFALRGAPRQQVAGRARAGARRPSASGRRPRPRRDRHRRARPRRARHHARDQLRPAQRARELRAPHRSHGARGAGRAWRSRSATAASAPTSPTSSARSGRSWT